MKKDRFSEELGKQRAIKSGGFGVRRWACRGRRSFRWKRGKYNPSLALAFKPLARYFRHLSIEAIFDDSDESTDATLPQ